LGVIYALANPFFPNLGALFANYFILILIGLSLVNFAPLLILPALSNPQQPGDEDARLQIRANRVASGLFFIFLMLLLGSAVGSSIQLALSAPFNLIASSIVALVIGMASMQWYAPFQRWFDTRVLNIPIQPERLLETYSERILTSLDQNTLNNLFLQEVLPSWLVRQFTLLQLEGEDLQPLIILGVEPQQLPQRLDSAVDWARLSLPLSLGGKPAGLMLFGRRDPDDFYAANEMAVLQQIANLTALALANIKQSSALQELYQTDIERQETERTTLAAELHDDVLQHMALLSNQLADLQPSPELLETYQYTANRIREITSGLRTPLLAFGLASALEGLVDNAQDRELKDLSVVFDMAENDVRLDERLELHLFRLVQQALDNALQHAQASQIRLGGSISPSAVNLSIIDNGVGFASGEKLDITSLLANKHFGVAGMFERAALIGAEIAILSQPGQGCQVNVRWAAK
jgi:signal transduction histidine kinase